MQNTILGWLVPLVIGPLTAMAMQALKALSATVDALSPTVKRIAVAVIAIVITFVARWVNVTPPDCSVDASTNCIPFLSEDWVRAALGALIAYLLHYAKPAKPDA